ncbi:MAG: halocarboxylic acid dehydrogenase DehI family protein [Chloroflexota bacterium]
MVQAPAEVAEAEAEGKVKATYEDIKSTLRVPVVNLVFRLLAAHPDFLETGWVELKPNAQTVFFEQQADAIRAVAVDAVAGLGQAPAAPDDEARKVLAVFHYINPKLLLAVGALRAATRGQQPKLSVLSADQKRQITPGIPSGAPARIELVDATNAVPPLSVVFADIQTSLGVDVINTDYRALANWPAYFEQAWAAVKAILDEPEYQRALWEMRQYVEEAVVALPYRMDLNPHVLRQAGLGESDLEAVQDILTSFYRLLPGLIANVAFLAAGAVGSDGGRSPFPATVL